MFEPLSANPYIPSYLKLCTECVRKKHLNDNNLVATMSMRNNDPKEPIRNGHKFNKQRVRKITLITILKILFKATFKLKLIH